MELNWTSKIYNMMLLYGIEVTTKKCNVLIQFKLCLTLNYLFDMAFEMWLLFCAHIHRARWLIVNYFLWFHIEQLLWLLLMF